MSISLRGVALTSRFITASLHAPRLLAILILASLPPLAPAQSFQNLGDIPAIVKDGPHISAVGLSRDGTKLALAESDPRRGSILRFYDCDTRKETGQSEYGLPFPRTLLFSPDGKTLIIHSQLMKRCPVSNMPYHRIEFWSIEAKRARHRLKFSPLEARMIHLTADGKTLVVRGERHVLLVDAQTGKPRVRFPEYSESSFAPSVVSPDGKWLAVREPRHDLVRVYDVRGGILVASLRPFPKGLGGDGNLTPRMTFTLDSKGLTVLEQRALVTFAVPSGNEVARIATDGLSAPHHPSYTKDGKELVILGSHGPGEAVVTLSPTTGKVTYPPGRRPTARFFPFAISGDGRTFALVRNFTKDCAVLLWRVDTEKK